MSKNLKLILNYLLPSAAAIFLVVQVIFPSLAKSKFFQSKRKPASVAIVNEKPGSNLKKVADGVYYNFKNGYSCLPPEKTKAIPSYYDAIKITKGSICRLGDACGNSKENCQLRMIDGAELSADHSSIQFQRRKYVKQNQVIPDKCVMPSCAVPPDICRFDEMPPLNSDGCPMGCGTIVCKFKEPGYCPELNCPALPQGCEYDGKAPTDQKGCLTSCGQIVCDSISRKEFTCPALNCTKPPENCRYDDSAKIDKNGCQATCGEIICARRDPNKPACQPGPVCPEPPAGCRSVGEPAVDKDGCRIGCGGIACKKNIPDTCSPPKCDAPSEYCRYDGNSTLDFKGCQTGCGGLICN